MAASITLSAVTVGSDGKTVTATLGGGTVGYKITDGTQLSFRLPAAQGSATISVASVSINTTTLTMVLQTPVGVIGGTAETVRLDVGSTATISDAANNTPAGQGDLPVTNNSTVPVRVLTGSAILSAVEAQGQYASTNPGDAPVGANWLTGTTTTDACYELVTDATDVAVTWYGAFPPNVAVDTQQTKASGLSPLVLASGQGWTVCPIGRNLSAGRHLLRWDYPSNVMGSIRLSGTNTNTYSVPTAKSMTTNAPPPAGTTQLKAPVHFMYGAIAGTVSSTNFQASSQLDVGFTGSCVETYATSSYTFTAYLDGKVDGPSVSGTSAAPETVTVCELANGAHTMHLLMLGANQNGYWSGYRVLNGTRLTAAAAQGSNTLQVEDGTKVAAQDWLRMDKGSSREYVQVQSISGNTITLATNLQLAHAVRTHLSSYSAPAAALTAYDFMAGTQYDRKRRAALCGDSNTSAYTDLAGTTGPQGQTYGQYDLRTAGVWIAAQALGFDTANVALQGTIIDQHLQQVQALDTNMDLIVVFPGTNDINGTTKTPAQYGAVAAQIVTAAQSKLRAGGRLVFIAPATPQGSVNSGGLSIVTAAAQLRAQEVANPGLVTTIDNIGIPMVAADYNGLHYHLSGQDKIRQRVLPTFAGVANPFSGLSS